MPLNRPVRAHPVAHYNERMESRDKKITGWRLVFPALQLSERLFD
jgi:hypothetical protein